MLLVYLFLIHTCLWLLYILIMFFTPYSKMGLKNIKFKGQIEEEINKFLAQHNVYGIELSRAKGDDEYVFFDFKDKYIRYLKMSEKRYRASDLYTGLHEAAHALQDKERHWATYIRQFWNSKCKKAFLMFFTISFFYSILFSMSFGWDWFWYTFIVAVIFHYLFCFTIVIPSEINAHYKAYKYIMSNYPSLRKNKFQLIKSSCFSIFDYIMNIPLLIIFG